MRLCVYPLSKETQGKNKDHLRNPSHRYSQKKLFCVVLHCRIIKTMKNKEKLKLDKKNFDVPSKPLTDT